MWGKVCSFAKVSLVSQEKEYAHQDLSQYGQEGYEC